MKDETYVYIQDVKEKKITARSARNTRTHNGKSGRVKLPSDYMTPKELKAMNGECKSYRMNDPLSWGDFKVMPDDLKIIYIKQLREKYNIPDSKLAEAMGIGKQTMIFEVRRLGLSKGKGAGGIVKWKQDEFYSWWSGEKAKETTTEAECTESESVASVPIEEEKPTQTEASPEILVAPIAEPMKHKPAVPVRGELTFCGSAEDALKTAIVLLGGANVQISLSWEAITDEE